MKERLQLFITCLTFTIVACKQPYTKARIEQTTREIVHIIKTGEADDFRKKIGVPIKDDDERFKRKFNKMKKWAQRYADESNLKVMITDSIDPYSGQRLIIVPIVDTADADKDVKSVHLHFYFGPPQMISWKKISGYEMRVMPRFP